MPKRKASVQLSPSKLVCAGHSPSNKRPKLAPIITVFERRAALSAVELEDSAPSPLDYPWMEWPWDDEDETDSLFDEPADAAAHNASAVGGNESADAGTSQESTTSIIVDAASLANTPEEASDADSLFDEPDLSVASRTAPPIPGLQYDPSPELLLPQELASSILAQLNAQYFPRPDGPNQVMLFTRPSEPLPAPLDALLAAVAGLFHPSTRDVLFAPRADGSARQAIVNRYAPGEGIGSHVDLVRRYGDGIVGVSLGAGCAMRFAPVEQGEGPPVELWLPERSVLALGGAARYEWTHGIPPRAYDLVEGDAGPERVDRGTRVSVTFRWLLPGAHVVGEE